MLIQPGAGYEKLLSSQVGTGDVSDSQVEVLRQAVPLQAAVSLSPTDFGGQGLPVFKALTPNSTVLQTGHYHLRQVLLEPLEVLPVNMRIILDYGCKCDKMPKIMFI